MSDTAISVATSVATTNATITASEAIKTKIERCNLVIEKFDSKTSTVQEMQAYSDCVTFLYPQKSYDVAFGILAAIGLLAGVATLIFLEDDAIMKIIAAIAAMLATPLALGIVAFFAYEVIKLLP